ncbi:peptidoglycan-associated lipoprotein Pal [Myxococcota bacterium]|nr:peptidoglycan-associated lipoprotein Pal [Myxococcota bacterium]
MPRSRSAPPGRLAPGLAAVVPLGIALALAGCTKQVQVKDYGSPLDGAGDRAGDGASAGSTRVEDVPDAVIDELRANFEKVYFEYDSHDLTPDTRSVLERNATILKRYATLRVTLEGHCDDRGSTEYNLALGERRASSVQEYLVGLGVRPEQLERVSYGEERPEVPGEGEGTRSRNRRVEFVATVHQRS